jgi:hypothetical protein
MGYYVRSIKNPKRPWAVLYRESKDGERVAKTIADEDLGLHQFSSRMSIEEARERASELNKKEETKRYAAKKIRTTERIENEARDLALSFPDEEEFLVECETQERLNVRGTSKLKSHWHTVKKIIAKLNIKPEHYAANRRRIYFYFKDNAHSFDYCVKLLRFINLYGRFYARRYKVYFEHVPPPSGMDKADILNAHHDAVGQGNEATPLTWELLESKRSKFSEENYNWLYLSLWLGLRPLEVDSLKKGEKHAKWETDKTGTKVLWVLQTKLRSVVGDKKWKPIPLLEPEQQLCEEIIKSKKFKRPLVKTISSHFADGYNTYSGRKGFQELMESRGHEFFHFSQWLGHQSVDRTWKDYTNKKAARYKKAGARPLVKPK